MGHVGGSGSGLDQLEGGVIALVDDLDVLFGECDVDFLEPDVELQLLFNLRFRDVKVLSLGIGTTDETCIIAICCSSELTNAPGRGYFYHVLMVVVSMRSDYRIIRRFRRSLFA